MSSLQAVGGMQPPQHTSKAAPKAEKLGRLILLIHPMETMEEVQSVDV